MTKDIDIDIRSEERKKEEENSRRKNIKRTKKEKTNLVFAFNHLPQKANTGLRQYQAIT